jgi:hypothetical protein
VNFVINKLALANAFGLTTAILWVLCSLFVFIFPELSLTVTEWMLHGLDLASLGAFNLTLSNFVLGGVSLVASAWVTGLVLGWSLEILAD